MRSQESDSTYLENEAIRLKQTMIQLWNRNLNNPKRHFWQQLCNGNLSKVYEDWRNTTPIVLPRKFQIKRITNEPDDQRRKGERQVLNNFRTEKELLELRSQSHMQHVERIDVEMTAIIADKCNGRRSLHKRVPVHNHRIRNITTRIQQASTHIDNCAQSAIPKYHIFPFFKMQTDSIISRKKKRIL